MWDFSTDTEFRAKLDWVEQFVRQECEPLASILTETLANGTGE